MRTAKVLGQTHSLQVLTAVSVYSLRLPPFSSSACDLEMQSGLGVMPSLVRKMRLYEHHQLIAFNIPWRWWCSGSSVSVVLFTDDGAVEGQELYRLSSGCFMWLKFLIYLPMCFSTLTKCHKSYNITFECS